MQNSKSRTKKAKRNLEKTEVLSLTTNISKSQEYIIRTPTVTQMREEQLKEFENLRKSTLNAENTDELFDFERRGPGFLGAVLSKNEYEGETKKYDDTTIRRRLKSISSILDQYHARKIGTTKIPSYLAYFLGISTAAATNIFNSLITNMLCSNSTANIPVDQPFNATNGLNNTATPTMPCNADTTTECEESFATTAALSLNYTVLFYCTFVCIGVGNFLHSRARRASTLYSNLQQTKESLVELSNNSPESELLRLMVQLASYMRLKFWEERMLIQGFDDPQKFFNLCSSYQVIKADIEILNGINKFFIAVLEKGKDCKFAQLILKSRGQRYAESIVDTLVDSYRYKIQKTWIINPKLWSWHIDPRNWSFGFYRLHFNNYVEAQTVTAIMDRIFQLKLFEKKLYFPLDRIKHAKISQSNSEESPDDEDRILEEERKGPKVKEPLAGVDSVVVTFPTNLNEDLEGKTRSNSNSSQADYKVTNIKTYILECLNKKFNGKLITQETINLIFKGIVKTPPTMQYLEQTMKHIRKTFIKNKLPGKKAYHLYTAVQAWFGGLPFISLIDASFQKVYNQVMLTVIAAAVFWAMEKPKKGMEKQYNSAEENLKKLKNSLPFLEGEKLIYSHPKTGKKVPSDSMQYIQLIALCTTSLIAAKFKKGIEKFDKNDMVYLFSLILRLYGDFLIDEVHQSHKPKDIDQVVYTVRNLYRNIHKHYSFGSQNLYNLRMPWRVSAISGVNSEIMLKVIKDSIKVTLNSPDLVNMGMQMDAYLKGAGYQAKTLIAKFTRCSMLGIKRYKVRYHKLTIHHAQREEILSRLTSYADDNNNVFQDPNYFDEQTIENDSFTICRGTLKRYSKTTKKKSEIQEEQLSV